LIKSFTGLGGARGGGEYMSVANAFEIADNSVSFFTQQYAVNSFEFERVSNLQEDVFYDFYQLQLSHDLFGADICNAEYLDNLGESLDFQASMFQKFEEEFGKDNEHVIKRKKYYSLLQLSHLNFMKNVDKKCETDYNFIIYFYSNDKKFLDDSERISRLLRQRVFFLGVLKYI